MNLPNLSFNNMYINNIFFKLEFMKLLCLINGKDENLKN